MNRGLVGVPHCHSVWLDITQGVGLQEEAFENYI